MDIRFTDEWKWNIDGWTSFRAEVDGKLVTNRITEECLQDWFGAPDGRQGDEAAFIANRPTIEAVAMFAISRFPRNEFGGTDITSEVMEAFGALRPKTVPEKGGQ